MNDASDYDKDCYRNHPNRVRIRIAAGRAATLSRSAADDHAWIGSWTVVATIETAGSLTIGSTAVLPDTSTVMAVYGE